MIDAYPFHRFSTPRQERGTSLIRQTDATTARCAREGWRIVETVEDRGRSAWKGDHLKSGNLGRWRARVDAGEIAPGSVLLVENLDRLSRQNPRIARRWIEDLTDCGVTVAVCNPELVLDQATMNGANMGAIILHLLESTRANAEGNRRSEFRPKITERQLEKARAGIAFTKCIPRYLEIRDGRNVAIPERAALIVQIYEWAVTMGYDSITKHLNDTVPAWSGTKWNIGYIVDILNKPTIEGEYHPRTGEDRTARGEIVTSFYPRIVPAELVDRARGAIRYRATNKVAGAQYPEAKNLFSGVIKCAECGAAMTRTINKSKGKTYPYLICRGARAGSCRNTTQYRYDLFERAALGQILHLALDSSHFVKADDVAPAAAKFATRKKQVELTRRDVDAALDLLLTMPTSAALQSRLQKTEADLVKQEAALQTAQDELDTARGAVSPEAHLRRVMEVRHAIHSDDESTSLEARRLVRDAIRSVVSTVVFDRQWLTQRTVERRVTLVMKGNHLGWTFDGEGNVLERHDFTALLASSNPRDRQSSALMLAETVEEPADTLAAFRTIQRRHEAATALSPPPFPQRLRFRVEDARNRL